MVPPAAIVAAMAVHVQIDNIDPVESYTVGAAPRSVFALPFSFFEDADLIVEVGGTVMTLNEDYTVAGAAVTGAGVVTLTEEVTDTTVVITRLLQIERTVDFPNSGPLDMEALNTQLDKTIAMIQQVQADASGSTGQSILAQTIAARDAALLAAASLGGNLFTDYAVTPEQFGATGTAATDTAGIQAAIDSGATSIRYQPRDYLLERPGIVLASNQAHIGVEGLTKWKATEAMGVNNTSDMVYASTKENIHLYGIIFDGDGFLTGAASHDPGGTEGDGNFFFVHPISRYPGLLPCVHLSFVDYSSITRCKFIGYDTIGMFWNTGDGNIVEKNWFERTGQERLYPNYAFSCAANDIANQFSNGRIVGNRCINGGIGVTPNNCVISGNIISGWAMGAGINPTGVGWIGDNVISNNVIYDSNQNLDLDSYAPSGIENFGKRSVIANNTIYGCYGQGINQFAPYCTISGNAIYNNGSGGGGAGIYMLRTTIGGGEVIGADYNIVTGNVLFDTRVGAAKKQNDGYLEQTGSALVGTRVIGNTSIENRFNQYVFDGVGTESPERPWRQFTSGAGFAISASAGTFADITGTLFYNMVGTRLDFAFTSTTAAAGVGTASGELRFTIPFNLAREQAASAFNRADGTECYARGTAAASNLVTVRKYDGTFPAGNNAIIVASGGFEVTR